MLNIFGVLLIFANIYLLYHAITYHGLL